MRGIFLAVIAGTVLTVGCRGDSATVRQQPLASASAGATATLAQLVAQPQMYEGKAVVVEGTYNGACGDGDYYFKDKFDLIEFEIVDNASPRPDVEKLEKGTRVRLHGTVKVRRHEPEKQAESAATEEAGTEDRESEVRIAANRVEVIR